ncbi:hypothetical protein GCM10007923_02610 [Shinella yambaruensis]|uniref:Uncharacterized protein n=1 Tax=Shinella yambaruensis TaxID=415996 RepID=A0ABQ5ZAM0_9HYPH|nr:hypothetical protein GCM10007923_02610 [Shinella yambaruensis]
MPHRLMGRPRLLPTIILGLDPRIQAAGEAWMLGSSPSMTEERACRALAMACHLKFSIVAKPWNV